MSTSQQQLPTKLQGEFRTLVKLYEQIMVREVMYQKMLRHNWNIGPTANI
jgi:hypothetical protein